MDIQRQTPTELPSPSHTLSAEVHNKGAKHSFHSNPDILDEICEYLSYEYDEFENIRSCRNTLLNLALTCRAFLEPALDRLWRYLDSMFPLLRMLPAFVQSDGTYVLRGPISPEDWGRFEWYARRIRKFTYMQDPDDLDIALHVYVRLAQLCSTPIMPSLRHLHCPNTSQKHFFVSALCLFISPSLQTLELNNVSGEEDKLCGTVLHTLLSEQAQMEKIIIRGKGLSKDTVNLAIRFEYLRELEIDGMGESLDITILEQIGKLPWLFALSIDFTNSLIPLVDRDIGFRDLRSLLVTASVPFILSMLPNIMSTTLETFFAVSPTSSADKKDLLEYVVNRWKDTLRRIALVHKKLHEDSVEDLSLLALAPLFPLRKLTYVGLEGYNMELTDLNVESFARAWPKLNALLLPFINAGHQRPTIASLRTLTRLLPDLRELRIPLHLEDVPPFVSTGTPHIPIHDLHTLTIASADEAWDLRDLLYLARHIDYFFPKLRCVGGHEAHRDHGLDRWSQVHDMIVMYQAVRKEAITFERARVPVPRIVYSERV